MAALESVDDAYRPSVGESEPSAQREHAATPVRKSMISALMARVSIGSRILTIVAVGLLALVSAGAVQFYANTISDQVAKTAADLRKISSAVNAAAARLSTMELTVARLNEADANDSQNAFNATIAQAVAELDAIGDLLAAEPVAGQIAQTRDEIANARALFAELIESQRRIGDGENAGLAATLRASGAAIEDELKLWSGIPSIRAKLSEARRFETVLLIQYGDGAAGRLNKAINELDFFIPSGPFGPSDQEKLFALLAHYKAGLNAIRDEAGERKSIETAIGGQFTLAYARLEPLHAFAAEGLERADQALAETRYRTAAIFVGGGAVAIALFLVCSLLVARSIAAPIRKITDSMGQLAAGDHSAAVPGLSRRDEIGRMAKAIEIFKDNALEIERIRSAEQDALERAADERRETLQALADDFERSVRRVATALNVTAGRISDAASHMARDAQASETEGVAVADLIGESADAVGMIVHSADDLGQSVATVDIRMTETASAIDRTLKAANETTELVASLSHAAERIGEVVDVINTIAEQTNLLALNATIEAARAGEAGRGFAVVANEVKALATQTATATDEITSQVAAIRSEVERTVSAINLVRDEVGIIDGLAEQVSGAVHRQEKATNAIVANVSGAAQGAETMTNRIAVMTQAVQQTARSASDLVGAAEELAQNSSRLEVELEGFLVTVRQG